MTDEHNWTLLYKFDGDIPREFYEIRQLGTKVWIAKGRAKTLGVLESVDAGSADAARARYQEESRKAEDAGYTVTRSGRYDPASLNEEQLTAEIYEGAKKAFTFVRNRHPDQTMTYYGLLSDDSAMTLVPAANSEQALDDVEHDEATWILSEWHFKDGNDYLDIPYRMILPMHTDVPCDVEFTVYKEVVYRSCVAALSRLRDDGFFGESSDDIVVMFQGGDSDAFLDANRQLNSDAAYRRYAAWAGAES